MLNNCLSAKCFVTILPLIFRNLRNLKIFIIGINSSRHCSLYSNVSVLLLKVGKCLVRTLVYFFLAESSSTIMYGPLYSLPILHCLMYAIERSNKMRIVQCRYHGCVPSLFLPRGNLGKVIESYPAIRWFHPHSRV